jgi:ankyrin repeat protein
MAFSGRFRSLVYEPKQSAVYWSAEFGLVDVTKFLLDKGINPNIRGCHFGNVLQAAAYGGYEVIVRDLLDAGATINAQGSRHNSALEAACCKGHIAVIDIFL